MPATQSLHSSHRHTHTALRFAKHPFEFAHRAGSSNHFKAAWLDLNELDAITGLDIDGAANIGGNRDLALGGSRGGRHGWFRGFLRHCEQAGQATPDVTEAPDDGAFE
jgi:hypothetical protein